MHYVTAFFSVLVLFAGFSAQAKVEPWVVDASHSAARFEISHLVISTVDGRFTDIGGEINFGEAEFLGGKQLSKAKFNIWAKAASIDTGNKKRDGHLKSKDFFNVKAKGRDKISFVSSKIKKKGKKKFEVTGKLTMNGKSKTVTFEGKYKGTAEAYDKKRIGLVLETEIERKDFGLTWNDVVEAGPVVGDDVEITLNIQAHRKADL